MIRSFAEQLASGSRKAGAFLGASLFAIALAVRLFGSNWGLPSEQRHWSLHPDEPVVWLYAQQVKPLQGKLAPGFYNYGTLYLSLGSLASDLAGPSHVDEPLWSIHRRQLVAMRSVSILAGASMAWLGFLLMYRRVHWLGAAFSGAVLAVAPGLVIHSRFATVDVTAAALLLAGLVCALLTGKSKRPFLGVCPYAWASGVAMGLSAGTKYTGIIGLLALYLVCGRIKPLAWKPALAGTVGALVAIVVATPGVILQPGQFWRDFQFELGHTAAGHGLVFAGTSSGFAFHFGNLMLSLGPILLLAGAAGCVGAVLKRSPEMLALAVFGLASYILIGRAEVKFLRYVFPLLPVFAAGAGWLVSWAHEKSEAGFRAIPLIAFLGLGGVPYGGLSAAMQASMEMCKIDPRDACGKWISENIDGGSVGLVSDPWFYSASLYPEIQAPRFVPATVRAQASQLSAISVVTGPPGSAYHVQVVDRKPDLIVFSSFETEGYDRIDRMKSPPAEFASQLADYRSFMQRLQKEYQIKAVFPPDAVVTGSFLDQAHDLMYVRPTLWVWKRRDP